MFDIRIQESGEIQMIGRFDAAQTDKAREALDPIDSSCVIDMGDLEYMSSAGLGILLFTAQRINRNGGQVTLKNISQNIRRILALSGMERIFTIEE